MRGKLRCKMRVLFAGSPAIAVPLLEALSAAEGITLAGVLTNPDSPKCRSGREIPTEVGEAAARIGSGEALPVLKPIKLDASAREQVSALKPDILVSFAYGRIFGPKFLALFPLGGLNIHPSLLPKYRGPAPIQAAILNRDTVTGISVQKLAKEMDSGDILAQEQLQLTGRETSRSLGEIMAQRAAVLLPPVLRDIAEGTARSRPQNHGEAGYCSLISRDNALIDWKRSAAEIDAAVRAFDSRPYAWTVHGAKELLILKAAVYSGPAAQTGGNEAPALVLGIDKQAGILVKTGEGVLAVSELQYQAKKVLEWRAFLNGARDFIGSILG